MNYIDIKFYEEFTKTKIDEDTFDQLVEVAARIIDDKTMNRAPNFDTFPDFVKE